MVEVQGRDNWEWFSSAEKLKCETCPREVTKGYRQEWFKGKERWVVIRCTKCWKKRSGKKEK